MHGYEMMKELQERSGGRYTASPGSVYPTLQMLEDRGFVSVGEVDSKKVYTITDSGRTFLAENQPEQQGGRWRGFRPGSEEEWDEIGKLAFQLREIGPLFGRALHEARQDPEKVARLRTLLQQVRKELSSITGLADED